MAAVGEENPGTGAGEAGTGGKASPTRRLRLGVSSSSSSDGSTESNGGKEGVATWPTE